MSLTKPLQVLLPVARDWGILVVSSRFPQPPFTPRLQTVPALRVIGLSRFAELTPSAELEILYSNKVSTRRFKHVVVHGEYIESLIYAQLTPCRRGC